LALGLSPPDAAVLPVISLLRASALIGLLMLKLALANAI
jgi:hypothetical protein